MTDPIAEQMQEEEEALAESVAPYLFQDEDYT